MRTLIAPIHAPGTYVERSRRNKHGLPSALAEVGEMYEFDFLSIECDRLDATMRGKLDLFEPDVLFLQIQGTEPITAEMLLGWRRDYPQIRVINWSGDVWEHALTSPEMLNILQYVDLQLVVNASVLPVYAANGIKADYCPFGYETPLTDLPDAPIYDAVFLGNAYSDARHELYKTLRMLPYNVGVYGSGWTNRETECNYDFAFSEALYRFAKIAISDNQFPDARGYLSDRPFQIMAADGAVLLQQRVADLETLTGMKDGVHYVEWIDLDDLYIKCVDWLSPGKAYARVKMARNAQRLVFQRHTWEERVKQLVREWLPERVEP